MQKILVNLLAACIPYLSQSQTNIDLSRDTSCLRNDGIMWTRGLGWEQIKERASKEGKYIFLDCYTTWCGPCKTMDKNVFPDREVGQYFNGKFISVKIQMDKTANDNGDVKAWYKDMEEITKQYHVQEYPTFMFFSSDGKILAKETGSMEKKYFLSKATEAIKVGHTYLDPYEEYDRLKTEYLIGKRDYKQFPYLIKLAYKTQDDAFGKRLMDEHTNLLQALSRKDRYSRETIELWSGFMLRSDGPRFKSFLKDGYIIDTVMKKKGYSAKVIDRTLKTEIVDPFLEEQAKGSGIKVTGMYLAGSKFDDMKSDYSEADWRLLYKLLRQKVTLKHARRNVVLARAEWYLRHKNYKNYTKYYLIKLKKYTGDMKSEVYGINSFGFHVFLQVTDIKVITEVTQWIKKAMDLSPNSDIIDTYANLLYKAGKIKEAIMWQEVAIKKDPTNIEKMNALEKMMKFEPTYVEQGAIWDGVNTK